jgi:hypothetical protein
MAVRNRIHTINPTIIGISRSPADTVRASAPAHARVAAIFIASSRSSRVGPGITFIAAQKARIKRQTAAKSQMSSVNCDHTPPGMSGPPAVSFHCIKMENRHISNHPIHKRVQTFLFAIQYDT